jgi:hypothetical protein
MECQVETGAPNFSSFAYVNIPESGVIEIACERGHRTATIIQETKFEILSEMGVRGIVNESYRDAVSSFATSIERLYEYFIVAACRKRGIPPEIFATTWKPMASLTERQIGAFLATFLLDTGQTAKLLPPKQVEFRNAVIHKGRFPTREEAIKFGQAMFECALPVLTNLRSTSYAEIVSTLTFERIIKRSMKYRDAGVRTSTMSVSTPLSFTNADQPTDIEAIVATYANQPDAKGALEQFKKLGESRYPPKP